MPKPQSKIIAVPTHDHAAPRKSDAIPRQSLAAAVVERLRDKILHGELREGEQLRQDAIAAEFQISRIPVREALSHLAAEGLITIVANRGAVVPLSLPTKLCSFLKRARSWNATCSARPSPTSPKKISKPPKKFSSTSRNRWKMTPT